VLYVRLGHARPNWAVPTIIGLPPLATELRTSPVVRFVQILLKKSKIEGLRKSRECRMLAISAAARLCSIDVPQIAALETHERPLEFSNFQSLAKRTFSTQSAMNRHGPHSIRSSALANMVGLRSSAGGESAQEIKALPGCQRLGGPYC
jgi:hypothetical protein